MKASNSYKERNWVKVFLPLYLFIFILDVVCQSPRRAFFQQGGQEPASHLPRLLQCHCAI